MPHTAFYTKKYLLRTNIVKMLSNCHYFSSINVSMYVSESKSRFLATFHHSRSSLRFSRFSLVSEQFPLENSKRLFPAINEGNRLLTANNLGNGVEIRYSQYLSRMKWEVRAKPFFLLLTQVSLFPFKSPISLRS